MVDAEKIRGVCFRSVEGPRELRDVTSRLVRSYFLLKKAQSDDVGRRCGHGISFRGDALWLFKNK